MRISLNLYKIPSYKQQNNSFKGQNAIHDESTTNISDAFYSESGIRAATLPYDWKSPKIRRQRNSRTLSSQDQAGNTKIREKTINSKADTTGVKISLSKPMNIGKALKTFKNPNDMQNYFVALYDTTKKHREAVPENGRFRAYEDKILGELVDHIEYKINEKKLDPKLADTLYMNEREQVRLGALFAYWSIHYDGGSRYGYKKPPYVRTTHELVTTLCNKEPYAAPSEFARFYRRLPSTLKKEEEAKRKRYDNLLAADWEAYKSLPFLKRMCEPYPERKMTFLEREEARVNAAYEEWADEQEERMRELKNQRKTELEVRLTGSLL